MSDDVLLKVENLSTWFDTRAGKAVVVDDVSFEIRRGETFALLGESGCGKSMTALSLMWLLPEQARDNIQGRILLNGENLLETPESQLRQVRGRRMSMIFQEPMTSLIPVLRVGAQIEETLGQHGTDGNVVELLDQVGIPDPGRRALEYPHQLSGGMKQRVMIAMALAARPELLIADEPTTALDVTIQAQVLELLHDLKARTGMAMLFITHDLGVVSRNTDRVALMYAGQIIEQASCEEFFSSSNHPYARMLFESLPNMKKREQRLSVIPGRVPPATQRPSGCRFEPRCDFAYDHCKSAPPRWRETPGVRCHLGDPEAPQPTGASAPEAAAPAESASQPAASTPAGDVPLLRVRDLQVHFPIRRGLFQRTVGHVRAVDGISLEIAAGKTLAIVGESGCGKTTAGKGILQLLRPTGGSVRFGDIELTEQDGASLRKLRTELQIIFQDPFASMNPRMMVGEIIVEGMEALGVGESPEARRESAASLLEEVGLNRAMMERYPHEFSGGQRQRISIARALAVEPKLIVCDEPTSALDVSVQAQILNLLRELQNTRGLSYLFITHNISVVAYLAHEVAVMYQGKIVERGEVRKILETPEHPYTQTLLSAVPHLEQKGA